MAMEQMPAEGQPQGPSKSPTDIIVEVETGLNTLLGMMQGKGLDGAEQALGAALEAFRGGIDALRGGAKGPQPSPGPASMEQGASKAVPAM
jgi:hypothetical protein